jgi:thiamine-phosphate pyrophosphorylase
MPESCILYYITDRTAFQGDEPARRMRLLDKIAEAAASGIDYIQLREKDLPARELESLAQQAMSIICQRKRAIDHRPLATRLLINSRTDVALAACADGVHLRSDDVSPQDVRIAWKRGAGALAREVSPQNPLIAVSCHSPEEVARGAGALAREVSPRNPLIAVSCHSPEEVVQAAANAADFAVFAPVFDKKDAPESTPAGLESLRQACMAEIPVFALGGITLGNVESCVRSGASGIAAIRLFQENDIARIVRQLGG